jgi:hypothetical protein
LSLPKNTTHSAPDTPGQKLLRYFQDNTKAGNMLREYSAGGCDLRVIMGHLESYLSGPPFNLGGLDLHEERRKRHDRTEANLKCAIKGRVAEIEFYRDGRQLADVRRAEAEKIRLEEYLVRVKETKAFDTKKLGAVNAKELPGERIVLVELDDYITKCTGGPTPPRELAWLVEAALWSIGWLPEDASIDPEILAKALKEFRLRNSSLTRLRHLL